MEQIDPRKLLVRIAQILEDLHIPYVITGGMAVVVWGRPRFTADIDTVIVLRQENIEKLADELMKLGDTGYVSKEAMKEALKTRGEFNFIDGNTGMKVDFWIPQDNDFTTSQFRRRVARNILNTTVYFVSPEDLILSKLRWHKISSSSRQLEDVESVFKISGEQLDKEYLIKWAEELKVSELLSPFLQK